MVSKCRAWSAADAGRIYHGAGKVDGGRIGKDWITSFPSSSVTPTDGGKSARST